MFKNSRLLSWTALSLGVHLAFVLLLVRYMPPLSSEQPGPVHEVEVAAQVHLVDPAPVDAPALGGQGAGHSRRSVAAGEVPASAPGATPVELANPRRPKEKHSNAEPRRIGRSRAMSRRAMGAPAAPVPAVERFAGAAADPVAQASFRDGPGPRGESTATTADPLPSPIGKDTIASLPDDGPSDSSGALSTTGGDGPGSDGSAAWPNGGDRRLAAYLRGIYRKVDRLWTFPKTLEVLFEQGDVLVQFTILADGNVGEVRIRKSSGFAQFDENVVAAIRSAAPFAPIPRGLGTSLRVLAPFEFSNPMVR